MADIDSERWRELGPLLDRALELSNDKRASWLAELRVQSPDVAAELSAILSEEKAADQHGFLLEPPQVSLEGLEVGAYTLERSLGHGGMGSVWLAHRTDGRFEGRAALKLMNLALLGPVGQKRFRREGTMLARLAHPGIARLLDAGLAPTGQPYLVIEYVDGEPIDAFAKARGLSTADRIRLALQVLEALGHAHANLIVHRDIKPSNILVTRDGIVKLLDFGIAKLLEGDTGEQRTALTAEGSRVLTLEFAAPEQVVGDPITTATDVYAVGVLLYLLLSGRHPTAHGCRTPAEVIGALMEAEPARLGMGDLDIILAKALRKAPLERYQTAAAFADDLRRYLAQQPVSARPDSLAYRARKFVRRHRAMVAAAAVVAITLVGASAVTTRQMLEARRQRDAAALAARRAEASSELQNFLLTLTGLNGERLSIEDQVVSGRVMLERQYRDDPRLLADMLVELSGRYQELNDFASQRQMLARAEELAASVPDPKLLARVHCWQAQSFTEDGHVDSAEVRLSQARTALRRVAGPLDVEVRATCLTAAAIVDRWRDRPDSAVARMTEVVRLLGANPEGRLSTRYTDALNDLSLVLRGAGRFREAGEAQRRILGILDSTGRGDSYPMAIAAFNTAKSLMDLGEYVDARALVRGQLERSSRGSRDNMPTMLAHIYGQIGEILRQDDTARAWFERVLQDSTIKLPTIRAQANTGIAATLLRAHRYREAAPFIARARAAWTESPQRPETQAMGYWLEGYVRRARGDTIGALAYLKRQLDAMGYREGKRGRHMYFVLHLAGECALAAGDLVLAEEYARSARAVAAADSLAEVQSALVGESMLLLARVLRAKGDPSGAAAALEAARAPLTHGYGPDHPRTREAAALADPLLRS